MMTGDVDVRRVALHDDEVTDNVIKTRMIAILEDTSEILARRRDGTYFRVGSYNDAELRELIDNSALTPGDGIDITDGVISATFDDTALRALIDGKADASHTHVIGDVTGLQTALDGKQNTLTAGANITIANDVISAADMTYDDDELRTLIDGKASAAALAAEVTARTNGDIALQSQIDAFAGSIILIGKIELPNAQVTQAALDARAQELDKYPPQKGYCLVDNDNDFWVWDGVDTWRDIGYFSVAQATNTTLGVVKGSADALKVGVDSNGEMAVNGLQAALDSKASADDLTTESVNRANYDLQIDQRIDDLAATIPSAANNGILTIQQDGVTVQTFGANQSTNTTANIVTPTSLPPSGAAGGDLTGTYPNPSLAAVTRTNNTSADAPALGATFTAIDTVTTDTKGRVTAINTKTVTLPTVPSVGAAAAGLAPAPVSSDVNVVLAKGATTTATPTWQKVTGAMMAGYPNDATKFFRGDGVWDTPPAAATVSGANLSSQQALFGQAVRHGTLGTFARSDHYHELPAAQTLSSLGAQAALNRTVVGDDNASAAVTDTGLNLLIPIPVTVTAGTATATLPTSATTMSLRSWLTTARNNLDWLSTNKFTNSVTGSRLLGRYSTTAGVAQEITIGTGLALSTAGVLTATGSGGTLTGVTAGTGITVTASTTSPTVALTTPVTVANGGTGLSSVAAYTILGNSGTAAITTGATIAAGTANTVLARGATGGVSFQSATPAMINLTGYGLVGRTTNSAGAASLIAFNGSTTQYLNGAGSFSTPAGGSGTVTAVTAGNGIATITNGTTTPTVNLATPASVTGSSTNSAGTANTGHTHAVSGLTVAVGGTGATTFTSGNALIGAGTGAITTRAIVTSVGSSTTSTSLVTEGAVRTALNSVGGGGAYIPLAGTASGSPTTGAIEYNGAASAYSEILRVTPISAAGNLAVLWRGTCGSGLDLYPSGTPSATNKVMFSVSGARGYGREVSLQSDTTYITANPSSIFLISRDPYGGSGPRGAISIGRSDVQDTSGLTNGDLGLYASRKIYLDATSGVSPINITNPAVTAPSMVLGSDSIYWFAVAPAGVSSTARGFRLTYDALSNQLSVQKRAASGGAWAAATWNSAGYFS
jgi:hypothetical protein